MMDRLGEWTKFSFQVAKHVLKYTIPQYASDNEEEDQVGAWTAGDCIRAIQRYVTRSGKGQRGPKEELRDLLKIAHYACIAYFKLRAELNEPDLHSRSETREYGA